MIEIFINSDTDINIIKDNKKIIFNEENGNLNFQKEINLFIESLEEQCISGFTIKDLYKYKGIEVYNFARGSICNNIENLINKFLIIEFLYNRFSKDDIIVYTNDKVYKEICKSIFGIKHKDLNVNTINRSEEKFLFLRIKRLLKGIIYFLKYLIRDKKNNNILVITQANSINNIKINGLNNIYDSQYGDILNELRKNNNIFNLQYLNNNNILKKSSYLGKDFLPFEIFILLKKIFFKFKIEEKDLNNKLDLLKEFDFNFHNVDLYNILEKFLFNNLESFYKGYLSEIFAAEKFIKIISPKKIIAIDEADRFRCFIYAGNLAGIKTFGIQHGIITEASVSYIIPSLDKNYIPNMTFLWGNEFKKILIEKTKVYDEDNVKIVGQIRTDYLYKKLKEIDCKSDNSNSIVKILYATQYIKDLTEEATEILFKSLSNYNKEYELLVKLHPADNFFNIYDDLIKKYNIKNIKITKDIDIYDAIIWSDVIVSVHSTVNLEALLLKKPSICILLSKYWDQGNFVKNNISIGVKNSEEFIEYLNNMNDSKFESNKIYLENNFYRVDGKVSERILKYLE